MRHAVHAVVGLDLGDAQLGHVGHLVHLLCEGLLRQQHLGLLVGFGGFALLQQVLDLLLQEWILLGGFLGFATGLLGLELGDGPVSVSHRAWVHLLIVGERNTYAGLKFDLHVAGELSVRHGEKRRTCGEIGYGAGRGRWDAGVEGSVCCCSARKLRWQDMGC